MTPVTSAAQARVAEIAARHAGPDQPRPARVIAFNPHSWRLHVRRQFIAHADELKPLGRLAADLLHVARDIADLVDAESLEADYAITPPKGRVRLEGALCEIPGVSQKRLSLCINLALALGILEVVREAGSGLPYRYRLILGGFDIGAMLTEAARLGVRLGAHGRDLTRANDGRRAVAARSEALRVLREAGITPPGYDDQTEPTDDVTDGYEGAERANEPVDNPVQELDGPTEPGMRHDATAGSRHDASPGSRHDASPLPSGVQGNRNNSSSAYWSSSARAQEPSEKTITTPRMRTEPPRRYAPCVTAPTRHRE